MNFVHYPENFRNYKNPEGLLLRNIHGDHGTTIVLQVKPLWQGKEIPYRFEMTPSCLTLTTDQGTVRICFSQPDVVLLEGRGRDLGLAFCRIEQEDGYAYPIACGCQKGLMINKARENCRYALIPQRGSLTVDQKWNGDGSDYCTITLSGDDGSFLLALREVKEEWTPAEQHDCFDRALEQTEKDFREYCRGLPSVPAEYEQWRERSAYVNWSCIVNPSGQLKRSGMLMSKNWMTRIWSWDHCFNAWASAYHNQEDAWNQFMVMFDFQNASGAIPDCLDDVKTCWNFCKPPVHGWVFRKMMALTSFSRERLAIAYDKLGRLTDWWFTCRDTDRNGICEYFHGNDSGWDNSTVFDQSPHVESPELSALLVIQCSAHSFGQFYACRVLLRITNNFDTYCIGARAVVSCFNGLLFQLCTAVHYVR